MTSFCSGCGFPQTTNQAFCPNCGARQQGAAAPAPVVPAVQMAPAMAPAKAGSGLKIVLALLAFMVVGGIAVVGGMFYLAHRVKQAVVEKAKVYGVDLPQTAAAHTSATPTRIPKACDVLTKQEVAKLIAEPVERSEPQDQACLFFGPAGLSAKLAQENAAGAIKQAETPGANVNAGDLATAMEHMATSAGAGGGLTGNGGEEALLMLTLNPEGKSVVTAMGIANGLFSGIFQASGAPKGAGGFAEISGLGDRAIRSPKLGLTVLKGDLAIGVIAGPLPDANPKTEAVARAVLGKL